MTESARIHATGAILFLFIPLVLFLFLQFPLGIVPSFTVAIMIMIAHRVVALHFLERNRLARCFFCGRTSRARNQIEVRGGKPLAIQLCKEECHAKALRFFEYCSRWKFLIRAGIFLPLGWYVVTMLMRGFGIWSFPLDWNRFIFRFLIACTVVSTAILFRKSPEAKDPSFAFPIHNLFLLGIRNTLVVFMVVGFWWLGLSLYFLAKL